MPGRIALFSSISIALALFVSATKIPDYRLGSLSKQEVQPIYSTDPHDPWNRIFYLLFTRTVATRLGEDFKAEEPFVPTEVMGDPSFKATSKTVERIETGDRAIDPLYPNFFSSKGSEPILNEPGFSELKQALQEASAEGVPRPPLQRALMQSDVWAAYDILGWSRQTDGPEGNHARTLLPLLAQFMAKLALTSDEIAQLPNNYLAAQSSIELPQVFEESSGWMEVEWFSGRSHDEMGENRHAARIFFKPPVSPASFLKQVNKRIRKGQDPLPGGIHDLNGAALITQVLLVSRDGHVVPSPLISDVQLRTMQRDREGRFVSSNVEEFELSRRMMLADAPSGGFEHRSAEEPSYLPASGNDFTFASPMIAERESKPPVLGTLRRRCELCHSESNVFTFAMIRIPGRPAPAFRQLRRSNDRRALYVANRKMKSKEFRALLDEAPTWPIPRPAQNGSN